MSDLSEDLTAAKVLDAEKSTDPYAIYGTEVPRSIPGSRQHWKSFSLDLVSFSEQRELPDLFVTLSAYDCWPYVQSTLKWGWGSTPTEEYKDVARDWEDRQAVGWSPEVAVMTAEKWFEWIMKITLSRDGDGPFGVVDDCVESEVLFTGICSCGVNLGPFQSIVSWLRFHEVQTQMTVS